ncbi:MAG: hypothetical protein JW802_07890 [Campylobacterales bacterium]|nr:hypothetical protein [Campylobacterales bacterium]MBN2833247.1 hypothetical protein [Campylobacterales bacterium]
MKKLYRTTFFPENFFGIDSVQGYLEMANWYEGEHVSFVCNKEDKSKHGSMLFILNQLETDDNIKVEWADYKTYDDKDALQLKQISLTVKGHQLLDDLKKKSRIGAFKKRAVDLLWVITTTIVTTLITLKVKGI